MQIVRSLLIWIAAEFRSGQSKYKPCKLHKFPKNFEKSVYEKLDS